MDIGSVAGQVVAQMPKTPRFPPNALTPRPGLDPGARPRGSARRRVEVLAFPDVQLLDVTGPLQVFATANEQAVKAGGAPHYAIAVVAKDALHVTASAGLQIATGTLPRASAALDTLIIAGGPGVDRAASDAELCAWVRQRAGRARRVASVCTGAFLLGASGVLDGRRAVTHWSYCDELARRHPSIRVEPDPIFVRDGDVWTSAGVTAGIDLALALVEQDLGRAAALSVARYLVMFLKRPGGQAQFSEALSLQAADDEFGALHDWIGRHLADDLSLSRLARQAGMSERSFSRHYARASGQTPLRTIERLRVEAARRLLSETRQPVKRIAQRCGFGSEETMRRSFWRVLAATPQDYRMRFGG
jgi:transcriptional regulator GlxA family with amidase domain